jgi:hypothetical protein
MIDLILKLRALQASYEALAYIVSDNIFELKSFGLEGFADNNEFSLEGGLGICRYLYDMREVEL